MHLCRDGTRNTAMAAPGPGSPAEISSVHAVRSRWMHSDNDNLWAWYRISTSFVFKELHPNPFSTIPSSYPRRRGGVASPELGTEERDAASRLIVKGLPVHHHPSAVLRLRNRRRAVLIGLRPPAALEQNVCGLSILSRIPLRRGVRLTPPLRSITAIDSSTSSPKLSVERLAMAATES